MRNLLCAFALLCAGAFSFGQTATVTGTITDPSSAATASVKLRFQLVNCFGNQPRVNGVSLVWPVIKEFATNTSTGAVSGTIYKNSSITCGSSTASNEWEMRTVANGVIGPPCPVRIITGSFNANQPNCLTTSATVDAPTGDGTYARLDATNTPFTGQVHISAPITSNNVFMVDGENATASSDFIIGGTTGYTPGGVYFNFVNGAGTTNRVFGTVMQATATAGGTGVVAEGETVAAYAGARRSAGTRPIWGLNTQAQIETVGNAAHSIEADLNNNTGVDATISNLATDQQFGVHSISGGTNHPQAAFRSTASSVNAYWLEGIQLLNWTTHGARIVGDQQHILMTPNTVNGNPQIIGTLANGGAGPWAINNDGSGYLASSTIAWSNAGVFTPTQLNLPDLTALSSSCTTCARIFQGLDHTTHFYGGSNTGDFDWRTSAGTVIASLLSSGAFTANGGLKAGASGSTIADTRELTQSVHSCGTTSTCANTANGSYREIFGQVTLSGGTATVSSITAFTSISSFQCLANDITALAAARAVPAGTTSITVTGTGTDVVNYRCVGN